MITNLINNTLNREAVYNKDNDWYFIIPSFWDIIWVSWGSMLFTLEQLQWLWFVEKEIITEKAMEIEYPFYWVNFINKIQSEQFNLKDYLSDEHRQDCCENVYIDFDHIDNSKKEIIEKWFIEKMEIYRQPWQWINVVLYNWSERSSVEWVNIFLACRNEQNWYYNDDLDLIVSVNWIKKTFDLRKLWCIEDDIN